MTTSVTHGKDSAKPLSLFIPVIFDVNFYVHVNNHSELVSPRRNITRSILSYPRYRVHCFNVKFIIVEANVSGMKLKLTISVTAS